MKVMQRISIAVLALAIISSNAGAQGQSQEQKTVAFDIGTTAPIALLVKLSDNFALRPDLSFAHFDNGGGSSSLSRFALGISGLASVSHSGPLTTYLGARGGYAWYSESNAPSDWSIAGIFGGRYALDPRFGISGETGLVYDRIRVPQPGADESSLTPWARLSVLLFF